MNYNPISLIIETKTQNNTKKPKRKGVPCKKNQLKITKKKEKERNQE